MLEIGHGFAAGRFVPTRQALGGAVEIAVGGIAVGNALAHGFLDVNAGGTSKHHQIQQRIAAKPVRAMNRNAGDFADGVQAFDDAILAVVACGERLAIDVGGYAAHHVVAGRHHRDGFPYGVCVGEGLGEFDDARQALPQGFLAQVIELQQHMVGILSDAAPIHDFLNHRPRHHVAAGQVLGGGRIAFHETLAVLVDQIAAFAATAFGDQDASPMNAGGMELPHLDVLRRHAGA